MMGLNLALCFHNLRQRKNVIAVAFFSFRFDFWKRNLICRFLVPAPFGLYNCFQVSQLTVVFLNHVAGFEQLAKSLLVENWFVFLGHDFSARIGRPRREGRRWRAGIPSYFSAISSTKRLLSGPRLVQRVGCD